MVGYNGFNTSLATGNLPTVVKEETRETTQQQKETKVVQTKGNKVPGDE